MITDHAIFQLRRSQRSGIRLGLATMQTLLAALGHPECHFRKVLVAGTNGKGSTSHYLASLCAHLGIRTGLYTSPHLVALNERFWANGEWITDERLLAFLKTVRQVAEAQKVAPTFFEILTAGAHLFFHEERVDLAVLEVGLGGRLDATNVGDFEVVILTDISFDHGEFLGNDLQEIAREKAAVIRPGGDVVTTTQVPAVMSVIEAEVARKSARLWVMERHFDLRRHAGPENLADFQWEDLCLPNLPLPLPGRHQRRNLALALAALVLLQKKRYVEIKAASCRKALTTFRYPGRFQEITLPGAASLHLLLDGAHNEKSLAALFEALGERQVLPRQMHLVLAIKGDKRWEKMMQLIPSEIASLTVTQLEGFTDGGKEPFVPAVALWRKASELGVTAGQAIAVNPNPWSAFLQAKERAGGQLTGGRQWVVVTGSLYLTGEILRHLSEKGVEWHA